MCGLCVLLPRHESITWSEENLFIRKNANEWGTRLAFSKSKLSNLGERIGAKNKANLPSRHRLSVVPA